MTCIMCFLPWMQATEDCLRLHINYFTQIDLNLKLFMCASFSGNCSRKQAIIFPRNLFWFCSLSLYKQYFWNLLFLNSSSDINVITQDDWLICWGTNCGHSIAEVNVIFSCNCLALNISMLGKTCALLLLSKELHKQCHWGTLFKYFQVTGPQYCLSCKCWSFKMSLCRFHSFN